MTPTPATIEKREALLAFIGSVLQADLAVRAVIGIGSIATGLCRPDSDIDAVIFLDPFDWYIVPAESTWRPSDGTFHSIFTQADWVAQEGVQLDFARCDLKQWADPAFTWPEGRRAELAEGWLAFARTGAVAKLIAERTDYGEGIRVARLDEAITWLDQHLGRAVTEEKWATLGPVIAHHRLQAAYDYLVQALFAYNRRWRPWYNREMSYLLRLPWLPPDFAPHVLSAANPPGLDLAGYLARYERLHTLFGQLLARLQADGDYGPDPIGEAFIRRAEEPGRSWNMAEWKQKHAQRVG